MSTVKRKKLSLSTGKALFTWTVGCSISCLTNASQLIKLNAMLVLLIRIPIQPFNSISAHSLCDSNDFEESLINYFEMSFKFPWTYKFKGLSTFQKFSVKSILFFSSIDVWKKVLARLGRGAVYSHICWVAEKWKVGGNSEHLGKPHCNGHILDSRMQDNLHWNSIPVQVLSSGQ